MTLTIPQQLACLDVTIRLVTNWRDTATEKGDTKNAEEFDRLFIMFEEMRLMMINYGTPDDLKKWNQMQAEIRRVLEISS